MEGVNCRVQGRMIYIYMYIYIYNIILGLRADRSAEPSLEAAAEVRAARSIIACHPAVLNLRTTTSQKCEAVPRRARI